MGYRRIDNLQSTFRFILDHIEDYIKPKTSIYNTYIVYTPCLFPSSMNLIPNEPTTRFLFLASALFQGQISSQVINSTYKPTTTLDFESLKLFGTSREFFLPSSL